MISFKITTRWSDCVRLLFYLFYLLAQQMPSALVTKDNILEITSNNLSLPLLQVLMDSILRS